MRNKKLTLIELIIVVLVLGLLVGLAIPQFTGVKANADVVSFKNDIDVLTKAIDESYVKEDNFPLGEKVTITDPALLDVIYASGDSATNLYKVDLSKTSKYHSKLKSINDANNYFIYSKETGKVFYTKGLVDGESKTLYTLEHVGLTGVKLGAKPLVNGMSVPVTEPIQTITGNVPASSIVEVKVNGTDLPVTVEDVVFDGSMDLMAAAKTKTFTSEVLLLEGSNTITVKVDNQVTNFKINLGNNQTPTAPESPVIKPVAIISMTPEQGLTTSTNITWGYENSTAAVGRTITTAEWVGKQSIYTTEGSYTVRLRVQDSTGVWSDWSEKLFAVISANGIKEIETGHNYTFVLKNDGSLWATGYNNYGQIGTGDITQRTTFTQVQSGVKSVSAGSGHTLILKENGTLWATGRNNYGQLGSGNITNRTTFTQVQSDVKNVATGASHSLIIKEDGTLWATGYNAHGQLGTGDEAIRTIFVQVQTGVKNVSAGEVHTVILKEDGTLWATGRNIYGQLGTGDTIERTTFVQVESNVKRISAGGIHTLFIKEDNSLWVTGYNAQGQLGTGNTAQRSTFIQVQTGVTNVSGGSSHTLIIKEDGTLWVTGNNYHGQSGRGTSTQSTNFVQIQTGIKSISAGGEHSLIIKEDETLWASGRNGSGQLGIGNTTDSKTFIQVQH